MSKLPQKLVLIIFLFAAACAGRSKDTITSVEDSDAKNANVTARSLRTETINLTLSDAISLGLRHNRTIYSAYLSRIAQKFDLRVAEDRFTPKLVLSGNYQSSRNQDDHRQSSSLTPSTTLLTPYGTRLELELSHRYSRTQSNGALQDDGISFGVIQPLLRGAGRDIATAPVRLAKLTEQINRLTLKSTISRTITQIIITYRSLLQAQEQLRITLDALNRARKLLEANRVMIAAGRMAEFDIVQTEADVATQELTIEEARNQLDTARLALLQLLALDLNTQLRAAESLDIRRVEINISQALRVAKDSQPDFLQQFILREQAAINLDIAQNDRLWDVSLVGGANQNRTHTHTTSSALSHSWENYVGIQVEIPVNNMNQQQAEVQARINLQTQDVRLLEARQELIRDVTNAVRNIATRWRQFEIAQRARDLSLRKLEIEREKLSVGRSSNFQVLSFENDLRNAENIRLNAQIGYLNAQTELEQTLGTTLQIWDITLND